MLKKNIPSSILILLFFISCGKDPSSSSSPNKNTNESIVKVVQVLPDVQPHLDRMNEFMTVYLKQPKIDNLVVEYTDDDTKPLEAVVRGYCDKSGATPKVYLLRSDWVGPYSNNNYFHKEAAFFHLVGHCVFDRTHDDRTMDHSSGGITYRTPLSYMHSGFHPNQFFGGFGAPNQMIMYRSSLDTKVLCKIIS